MASRDIDYESNSDEDIPEPIESFRSADLPIISNPSPYDSDNSSSSDSEDSELRLVLRRNWVLLFLLSACHHKPLTICHLPPLNLRGRDY